MIQFHRVTRILSLRVPFLALLSLLFAAGPVSSQETFVAGSAHAIVKDVQDQLLNTIRNGDNIVVNDEAAYFEKVSVILTPIVDFSYIARGVMGPHFAKVSSQQQVEFTHVFKDGLVSTYAKGMANFSDRDISVLAPKGDISDHKTISVAQEVRGDDGVNRVSYTMKLNREGQWKLVNVVLNGINLGKTFRTQFSQAARQNDGDIPAVIAEWSVE